MASLTDLARHWSRQTDKGKGIRIEADALDVLNAHGVGEMLQKLAAEEQTDQIIEEIEALCPGAFGAPADVETANG